MAEIKVTLSHKDIDAIATSVVCKLKNETNTPQTYTVAEVAKIVKVHRNTILGHIRDGLLESVKTGKSHIITQQQLNKYLGA